jgi:hypothetical protein
LEEINGYSVARAHFRTFIYTKLPVRMKNAVVKGVDKSSMAASTGIW